VNLRRQPGADEARAGVIRGRMANQNAGARSPRRASGGSVSTSPAAIQGFSYTRAREGWLGKPAVLILKASGVGQVSCLPVRAASSRPFRGPVNRQAGSLPHITMRIAVGKGG
jgi:hypothetical protein